MVTYSPVLIAFGAVTAVCFIAFLYFSFLMHRAKRDTFPWRGIIKLISLAGVPATLAGVYARWFAAFWAFFLSACISVGFAVWGTDHSFLIVLFPLLFYYFFARFFLWEKADLAD